MLTYHDLKICTVDEVLRELDLRPKRTPEGPESAASHCRQALRWLIASEHEAGERTARLSRGLPSLSRWGHSVSSADSTITAMSELSGQAARFGQGAPQIHILLFLAAADDLGLLPDRASAIDSAVITAVGAASAKYRHDVQMVLVPPLAAARGGLATLMNLPAEDDEPRPLLRLVSVGAVLFKYKPSPNVARALQQVTSSVGSDEALRRAVDNLTHELQGWITQLSAKDSAGKPELTPYLTDLDRGLLLRLSQG